MAFQYTGYRTLVYFKYLDQQAEHTLVADPGGEYDIMATESGLPVPPADGHWVEAPPPAPPKALPPALKETAAASSEKAGE